MTLSLTFKGFNYVSYYNGGYENADSLPALETTGANSVALTTDYGINAKTSKVYADANQTDSLQALSDTILQAESAGLSVMVRPLIDLVSQTLDGTLTGDWRDTYEPKNVSAFFASYKTMILAEATIAQQDGAQALCIGTELDQLTGPAYASEWSDIIGAIRNVYSGKLTYSADWDDDISPWTYSGAPAGTGNFATQISFWSSLDYIGIDEYAPISDSTDPSLQDLINGWTLAPTDSTASQATGGLSLITYFESLSTEIGKPILFTEIGYENSNDGDQAMPASATGVEDDAEQGSLYTAFFDAWRQSGNTSLQGAWFWNWDPNESEVGPGQINWSPQDLPAQTVVTDNFMACYAAGTHLATAAGETRVEALRVGDLVRTASGALRPIIWIGHRAYDGSRVAGNSRLLPVVIRAGALADRIPHRDLSVSPDHALLIDGVLIQASLLVNGASIRQLSAVSRLQYFHIELASHDILLAEGAPAESYLDTGNRISFANGPAWLDTHPDSPRDWTDACAELLLEGPRLAAIKQRLFAGGATPRTPLRSLQVAAGFWHLQPHTTAAGHWHYDIPPGATALRLISPPFIPAHCFADSLDRRRLGVRFTSIAIDGTPIPLDSPLLASGFYPPELTVEGACRWTDGAATLLLPNNARALVVQVPDGAHPSALAAAA